MISYKKIIPLILTLILSACTNSDYKGGGSLSPWLKDKIAKDGFTLKWNISGDYDITEEETKQYSQINTGQLATIIPSVMTFKNISRYQNWIQQKGQEPFPYPIFIVSAQCDKQIVFAQVNDANQFNADLAGGKFANCKPVSIDIGLSQGIPPWVVQEEARKKATASLKEENPEDKKDTSTSQPTN